MKGRLAVVFPLAVEAHHVGKDLFLIPAGLERLGFSVELHCPVARGGDWPVPVVEAGLCGLEQPGYWRDRDLAGAIVFSFLRHSRLLAAVKASGARVVAKGDTTGEVIARAHPRPTLQYAAFDPASLGARAASVAYWLARMGPLHSREARDVARAFEAADETVVETEPARAAAIKSLGHAHAGHLVGRLSVIPNPVADPFTRGALPGERARLVVSVGRWDLRVKGAPLLTAALERFLADHPVYRAVVVGAGAERIAAGARVEHAGHLPQAELVPLFGRARIVLSSSWWESFALASHEGLAMGCSVVGPDLAPLRDAVDQGPYGTVAHRRDPRSLAAALAAEAAAWERGARDPQASAAYWRRQLDTDSVAERFAALLQRRGGSASARS